MDASLSPNALKTKKEQIESASASIQPGEEQPIASLPELKKFSKKRTRQYRAPRQTEGRAEPIEDHPTTPADSAPSLPIDSIAQKASFPQGTDNDAGSEDSLHANPRALFKDLKEVRKIRSKPRGIDAQTLLKSSTALHATTPRSTEKKGTKSIIGLSENSQRKDADGLLSGFTSVNKTLDANQHMEKFIEEELSRKRRKVGNTSNIPGASTDSTHPNQGQPVASLEDELFSVPEHLKIEKPEITEGSVTVSTSMLTSIPEVNLGPETKLKAIEQTEKFRQKVRALHMFSNSQLQERALAFHNNPYPSMRWRISRKTRECLYDLQVADEILQDPSKANENYARNVYYPSDPESLMHFTSNPPNSNFGPPKDAV